ncbi:MAG TPA: hypothetical protein VEL07_14845 [Planctomycetota bacterium]|nr:hypothetical protein [Planctomycetota bacterium]
MADSRRPICLYHKNCLDGRGAAAVVQRKEKECDFVALQFGMRRPQVLGRRVYIVDFCLPLEDMRAVWAEASEVIWLDHHASQAPVRQALGWGVLDTSECGASLTWKTLFPDEPMPPVIAYIKDKDLWRWELPDSRAIAAGLEQTWKGDHFAGLLEVDLAEMAKKGAPLVEAVAKRVAEIAKTGVAIEAPYGLAGTRALAIVTNQDQNELGDYVCRPVAEGGLGFDLAILYFQKKDGPWVHSLRSSGADCARIASARGGGGHVNSACYLAATAFPHLPVQPVAKSG